MSTKTFSDPELELLHEAWHLPHMQRAMPPVTIVNQGERTIWHPRRMDLALATGEDPNSAAEGGTFREPAPARVPRRVTVNLWPLAGMLVTFFSVPLALWAYRTWFA